MFVPFGVDTDYFRPDAAGEPEADVVSIGADPRRDYALALRLARRHPERSFRVVASADHAAALGPLRRTSRRARRPFRRVRDACSRARVVALPVRDNTYSGATTALLQAMASGKPVVVSRTAAIAHGYHLEDGSNCRLVPPGDAAALEDAVVGRPRRRRRGRAARRPRTGDGRAAPDLGPVRERDPRPPRRRASRTTVPA